MENYSNKYCYIQCSDDIIEAGLCSCANRFYEIETPKEIK